MSLAGVQGVGAKLPSPRAPSAAPSPRLQAPEGDGRDKGAKRTRMLSTWVSLVPTVQCLCGCSTRACAIQACQAKTASHAVYLLLLDLFTLHGHQRLHCMVHDYPRRFCFATVTVTVTVIVAVSTSVYQRLQDGQRSRANTLMQPATGRDATKRVN